MENNTETKETAELPVWKKILIIVSIITVIGGAWYGYSYITADPNLEKEIVINKAYMLAGHSQDSIINGEQFVHVKILFAGNHDDSVQTETVLIARDDLKIDDTKAIIFKDSLFPLGICHLNYFKDGRKILKHAKSD